MNRGCGEFTEFYSSDFGTFEVGLGQGPGARSLLTRSPAFEEVRAYEDVDGQVRALAARTGQPDGSEPD